MIRLLNVGCGSGPLPPWLGVVDETRVDINPGVNPHIVASMTDLGEIGEYDCVWCSHALEHLSPPEVGAALAEFRRVLKPGGMAVVFVPDLEGVKPTREVLYESAAGPVTGHDMIYGHSIYSEDRPHFRHLTGFVAETMREALESAGFSTVEAKRVPAYNLLGVGVK